jgi:hypothetical protein
MTDLSLDAYRRPYRHDAEVRIWIERDAGNPHTFRMTETPFDAAVSVVKTEMVSA